MSASKAVLSFDGFSNSTSVVSRRDRTGLDILSDLCYKVRKVYFTIKCSLVFMCLCLRHSTPRMKYYTVRFMIYIFHHQLSVFTLICRRYQARTTETLEPSNILIVEAESEGQMNTTSGKPGTAATIDANLSRSRREIMWQGVGGNSTTLDDISYQFKAAVSSLSFAYSLWNT